MYDLGTKEPVSFESITLSLIRWCLLTQKIRAPSYACAEESTGYKRRAPKPCQPCESRERDMSQRMPSTTPLQAQEMRKMQVHVFVAFAVLPCGWEMTPRLSSWEGGRNMPHESAGGARAVNHAPTPLPFPFLLQKI